MDYTCKVESIETTSRGGKSIKLSGGWTGSALFTGKDKDKNVVPFPENEVKTGATIECTIETVKSGSSEWYALSFPKYGVQQSQGTTAWKGGGRPSEDAGLKAASMAMSYAKDMYLATPQADVESMFVNADKIANKLWEIKNRLNG